MASEILNPDPDDLLTREETAQVLRMKPQTLAIWASTGRVDLPYIKCGRSVRYKRRDIERFLARRTVNAD